VRLCKGDVRNFNENAASADAKRQSAAANARRLGQPSADELNRNWNAGDAEEAEPPAAGPDEEGPASDVGRKVSIVLPTKTDGKDGEGGGEEEEIQDESSRGAESHDQIAKLRRLSASTMSEVVDVDALRKTTRKPSRRRTSAPRVCIRRCIAEDETWDLKTVPDLDMLIVKFFVDNYAGTLYHWTRERVPNGH